MARKIIKPLLICIGNLILLSGCGSLNIGRKPQALAEIPPHLRASGSAGEETATVIKEGQSIEEAVMQGGGAGGRAFAEAGGSSGFARDEDMVWTDHNNPNAVIPELDQILSVREKPNDWGVSYQQARREASQSGMPLMLWFTNSQSSPRCKTLSEEILGDPEFESWAIENVRRVRLDANIDDSDYGLSQKDEIYVKRRDYLENLKKQYGVHGFPTVVLLGSDGEVIAKYRGYKKGEKDFYEGRLKLAVGQARRAHAEWKKKLENKGYRTWRNQKGQPVFAKLVSYRENLVTLVEPDGRRSRTDFGKLSDPDQIWLETEKLRYEERKKRS